MTATNIPVWLKVGFTSLVGLLLVTTLFSNSTLLLAGMTFSSLIILNGQFLIFPVTNDPHLLNRLSLSLTFGLLLIATGKFMVISGQF